MAKARNLKQIPGFCPSELLCIDFCQYLNLEDMDMLELSGRVLGKLRDIINEEFERLELTDAE